MIPVIRPDSGLLRTARRREWQAWAIAWIAAGVVWIRPASVFAVPFYAVGTLAAVASGTALAFHRPEPARRSLSIAVVAFIAGLPVNIAGAININPSGPGGFDAPVAIAGFFVGAVPLVLALAAYMLTASAIDNRREEWGRQRFYAESSRLRRRGEGWNNQSSVR
jgi:hypothetical protein